MLGKLRSFAVLALFCPWTASFAATEYVSKEDFASFYDMLKELEWDQSSSGKRLEIFERVEKALGDLDENLLKEKQDAYDTAKANEQSLANRTLTAVTTAATGIGGMELAQGLSEQKADKEAAADMAAYIATMRCTYGGDKQVKAGPDEIELPGGNNSDLMNYRTEYMTLVADLKERKTALGMKPGIESEKIIDKASTGLYDDENVGIDSGAYASLYRAQMLGSEADQSKIDEAAETSKKRVLGGAIAAGAGVLIGVVGNIITNKNADKGNSDKILSEREQIVSDLKDIMQEVIDECNEEIAAHKNNMPSKEDYVTAVVDDEEDMSYEEYVQMVNGLQPIEDINEIEKIKDIHVCK